MGGIWVGNRRGRIARGIGVVLGVVALVGAGLVPTSAAQASTCGPSFESPPDDAPNTATGGDESNVDQLDIIGGAFVAEDDENITVQITLKDLKTEMPDNATSINWYFLFTFGETIYFGRARIDATSPDPVFSYGTYDPSTSRYTTVGDASGTFVMGPNGTIDIAVPKAGVGEPAAGDTLTNVYAETYIGQGVPGGPTALSDVDRGPKEADTYGTDYVVGDCVGGGGGSESPLPKLRVSDKTPEMGNRIRATASLGVCEGHARTIIQLQRKVRRSFRKVAQKRLNSRCKATFRLRANFKRATFRSFWRQQDEDHGAAGSRPVTIRTHR